MTHASTLTDNRSAAGAAVAALPHLFVVLNCASPLQALPSRHSLDEVDEVRLGRGATDGTVRGDERGRRILHVTLRDPRVSSVHARISGHAGAWTLEDLSSKNGTLVNGVPARLAELADRDAIQLGHTLLVFRAALPTPARSAPDIEATARAPALATLLPLLASELDLLARVAISHVPVLLLSETGTGKDLLARALHALSRRSGAFVPVNCGGLPATLVESALFGHKRGAFSGAVADQPGLFRAADGGTLLLDELGDTPAALQSVLLRALQDGEVLPVGETRPVHVDVRIVSATHHDLEARVTEGDFREDLLARLSGFTFRLPPLRERREDIGLLIGILLREISGERRSVPSLSPEAASALLDYGWPRNIRELQKCLAHAAAVAAADGTIQLEHLPSSVRTRGPARETFSSADKLHARLVGLLAESRGNVSAVATAMRTSRSQVHRWMKRFAIEPSTFRR